MRAAAAAVKRLIGKEYEDVEQDVRQLAYGVGADEDGFVVLECPNLADSSSTAAAASDDGGGAGVRRGGPHAQEQSACNLHSVAALHASHPWRGSRRRAAVS